MKNISQRLSALAAMVIAVICIPSVSYSQNDIPQQIVDQMNTDKDCRDFNAEHMKSARETAQLNDNHTLYLLPCFTGAYNVVYRVYVFDKRYPNETKHSVFAAFSDEMGWYGQNQLINASFDSITRTLTAFEKGRGLGDCGSIPSYRWNEYGWRMISYRHWGKCDGSRVSDDWPVIYRFKQTKTPQ